MSPLFSIVVPVFNQVRFIRDCLESLALQDLSDVEVLLFDAGSTDGTLDIIDEFEGLLAHRHVGRDRGQSDALDKGFRLARGKYLTWLNSDDVLMPGALAAVRDYLGRHPTTRWLVGDTVLLDGDGQVTSSSRAGRFLFGESVKLVQTYGPSSFFSRELYARAGGLDLSFHYMMDTDLWWRFAELGEHYARVPAHFWGFRQHEESKTTAHLFGSEPHDRFGVREVRKNAELHELDLRYGAASDGYRERFSLLFSRLDRVRDLGLPLQLLETRRNRGKHWRNFERVTLP